jgi:hypothetical protein
MQLKLISLGLHGNKKINVYKALTGESLWQETTCDIRHTQFYNIFTDIISLGCGHTSAENASVVTSVMTSVVEIERNQ